jgi:cyclopropane-fatty-acyl-phospholipid synthase
MASAEIEVDGTRPWDVQIHDPRFYKRVIAESVLGLGESYMDGWWTCEALDQLFERILRADLRKQIKLPLAEASALVLTRLFNMQNRVRSKKVVDKHYDASSDIILDFLDPYNQYTCGYFDGTDDLNTAQEQKLDLICRKLGLTQNDRVLDIGCGWGGFAKFAAERYHCHITGISISNEQITYAKEYCKGLPVEFELSDYRTFKGSFSKIISVGMIEHVGYKNYPTLMKVAHNNLEDDGLFLLHSIGNPNSTTKSDPWTEKYIFPNSNVPSLPQLTRAAEGLFVLEDLHNFGQYYDPTLMAWYENFEKIWPGYKDRFDEQTYRMWKYYLLHLAGAFRARTSQLWQMVFSKKGVLGGYQAVR